MALKLLKLGEQLSPQTPLERQLSDYCRDHQLDVTLEWKNGQWWLHSDLEEERPITVEIDRELERHEAYFKKSSLQKELLAKAIGVKGSFRPKVFDLTAGLLGDTLLFLSFGCKVEAFERHPLIKVLIESAIQNATHAGIKNLIFHSEEARELNLQENSVLYFDPMFEDPNRKVSPRKEMRIFRQVVGDDLDAMDVFKKLRDMKAKRLVVKRPRQSRALTDEKPLEYEGKSTRYDVYFP